MSNNGRNKTPPPQGGVSPVASSAQTHTKFLPDIPVRTFAALSYASQRFLVGGLPVSRYVTLFLLALAALWATGLMPGRWWVVGIMLVATVVLIVIALRFKARDFVSFHDRETSAIKPVRWLSSESAPVYVTGLLNVEGREQRYTCLPGIYKTFATREHALMCYVRERRVARVIRWPEDEIGMWYAFFEPDAIQDIHWGRLEYAPDPMTSLAVTVEYCRKPAGRIRKKDSEVCDIETLYISSPDSSVIERIAADLSVDKSQAEVNVASIQSVFNDGR